MIKALTDRQEIAQALNFGKYPVVYVPDVDAVKTDYGWKLSKVRIDVQSSYTERAELYIFSDEMKLTTVSYGACLSSRFGWTDVKKDAEYAVVPVLSGESDFILVIGSSKNKTGMVLKITTGKVRKNCSDPMEIGDDMRPYLAALGAI